ncbi:UvrD-like helicase C-terminal domain-containing protein [Cyclonatronum proteinivorum]|uniref:UvrD-like helicase C-terminal domain-containing protein n=2 Tax=Cyclonatronum proteinivorum TaxID=1457365 RepID=A0A345UPN3_9BACT|nr:UvrD-like helicase C-terminal domain-containing protein [Cyclonatronum proteinivorum]
MPAQPLTAHQQKAFEGILGFLDDPGLHAFLLLGYAGTGKTFLLRHVLEVCEEAGLKTVLLAPTGRAARILEQATQREASTIHRALYEQTREYCTDEGYRAEFSLRENEDPDTTLYLIDEASMLSDMEADSEELCFGSGRLLLDLITYVSPYRSSRKLLFIGDPAQLPPVHQAGSPALARSYLHHSYGLQCAQATLTQVHRQQRDSRLLETATRLRSELHKAGHRSFHIVGNGHDIFERTPASLISAYARHLKRYTVPRIIWITHSNKAAHETNRAVRQALGYRSARLQQGELLMAARNHYSPEAFFMNGDQMRVVHLAPESETETVEVQLNYRDQKGVRVQLRYRQAQVRLLHEAPDAGPVRILLLENSLTDFRTGLLSAAAWVESMKRWQADPQGLELEAFRRQDARANALLVRFGYAITCHKAQGGAWETVILNPEHPVPLHKDAFIRWAYTALTRSRSKLCLSAPVRCRSLSNIRLMPIQPCEAFPETVATPPAEAHTPALPLTVRPADFHKAACYDLISGVCERSGVTLMGVTEEERGMCFRLGTGIAGSRIDAYFDHDGICAELVPRSPAGYKDDRLLRLYACLARQI